MTIFSLILLIVIVYFVVKQFTNLSSSNNTERKMTLDDEYNSRKIEKQEELDALLDKINKKGINKLSKKEKERLKELSN